MCDTFFITDGDNRYFAKNSDRSPNEPNLSLFFPERVGNKTLKCTYISIPDVERTFSAFMVKPSWTWGAEMGINSCGVAIGNEAVFTKCQSGKPSLIGMDYVRLVLERANSAKNGVQIVIDLLQEYGQGGNCGFDHNFVYDNSYLIADKEEAYILETAGKDWAVKKLEKNGNISNKLSIEKDYDKASKDFRNGFRKEFSDFFYTYGSKAKIRETTGRQLMSELDMVDAPGVMSILKHHRIENIFNRGDVGSICMHKNFVGDHTTGSMICNLKNNNPTIWITGSSTPCLAIYKPYIFGCNFYATDDKQESLAYWLKREYLYRAIFSGLVNEIEYTKGAKTLQTLFLTGERELRTGGASQKELFDFCKHCMEEEHNYIAKYNDIIERVARKTIRLDQPWQRLSSYLGVNPFGETIKKRKGL